MPISCNQSSDAHVGQVREFSAPKAPTAPSAPSSSDLSSELESFASSEPDHVEHATTSEGASSVREDVNAFLEEARKPYEIEAKH
jgi:F-type H+-transporting ATPase subunit h